MEQIKQKARKTKMAVKKKTLILFLVLLCSLILFQLIFGKKEIILKSVNTQYVTSEIDDYCKIIKGLENAEGVYFKFEYDINYKPSLWVFNYFVVRENFKKKDIQNISITYRNNKGQNINMEPYLSNYIDSSIFKDYISEEFINPYVYSLPDYDSSKSIYDDYIEPYEKMLEKYDKVELIREVLCKNIEKSCNALETVKDLSLLKSKDTTSYTKEKGLYCPNLLPEYNFTEESYVGKIDFFVKLYNKGYVQQNSQFLYPGFLMKLNAPKNITEKPKKIRTVIDFKDGTKITSE